MRDNTSRGWHVLRWRALVLAGAVVCSANPGCREPQPPVPTDAATPLPSVAIHASGPLADLQQPNDLLAYGGGKDARAALKLWQRLGGPELRAQLGLDAASDALGKEMRWAVFAGESKANDDNPSEDKAGLEWLLVLPSRGREALLKACTKLERRDERDVAISADGAPLYLDFVNDQLVISPTAKTLKRRRTFLLRLLGAELPEHSQLLLIGKALAARPALLQRLAGTTAASFLGESLTQLERVHVQLQPHADGQRLSVTLRPTKGGSLHEQLSMLQLPAEADLSLLNRLPADAPLRLALRLDPARAGVWLQRALQGVLQLNFQEPALLAKYRAHLKAFEAASTGSFAAVLHHSEKPQPAFSVLLGVNDDKAARTAIRKLRSAYAEKTVLQRHVKMGVRIKYQPSEYAVGGIPVDRVRAENPLLPPKLRLRNPPTGKPGGGRRAPSMFIEWMGSHTAVRQGIAVSVFGNAVRSTMETWLRDPPSDAPAPDTPPTAIPGRFLLLQLRPKTAWSMAVAREPSTDAAEPRLWISAGWQEDALTVVIDL